MTHNNVLSPSLSSSSYTQSFVLPSTHQSLLQLPLIYEDDIESQSNLEIYENLCPYCGEVLPNVLPEKLQIELFSMQGKPITEIDRYSFCIMHRAELHIIPNGLSKGYPEFIDFNQLISRVYNFNEELLEIINGNLESYYQEMSFSIYQEIGYNKAKSPMILFNRCEIFQVITIINLKIILFYNTLFNNTLFINL